MSDESGRQSRQEKIRVYDFDEPRLNGTDRYDFHELNSNGVDRATSAHVPRTPSSLGKRFARVEKDGSQRMSKARKSGDSSPFKVPLFENKPQPLGIHVQFHQDNGTLAPQSAWSPSPKKKHEYYVPRGLSEQIQQKVLAHETRLQLKNSARIEPDGSDVKTVLTSRRWNRHVFYVTWKPVPCAPSLPDPETQTSSPPPTHDETAVLVCINKSMGHRIKPGVSVALGPAHTTVCLEEGQRVSMYHEWRVL